MLLGRDRARDTLEYMETRLKQTPLTARHRDLGARLGAFAGYEMPIQYDGVLTEHRAVRESCGIFDVGHMGTVFVTGRGADDFLQSMLTNDVSRAAVGRAQYTMLCNRDGGVIDDLIISHLGDGEWMVVPNASNVAAVVGELATAAPSDIEVDDVSDAWAIIAIQGPKSRHVLDAALGDGEIGRFAVRRFACNDVAGVISGTGYTGSGGAEIIAPAETIITLWDRMQPALAQVGGRPTGLGARDTLRLEMGYPLHGQDLSPTISPFEAKLGWAVKLDKGDFRGRAALAKQKSDGPSRELIGFKTPDRRPPRSHCVVLDADDNPIGEVTSGNFSPGIGRGIGLALIERGKVADAIDIRGRRITIEVAKPPFVDLDH